MKIKKIVKVILIYAVFIYCGIWFNNFIHDKSLVDGVIEIFSNYDYRAVNIVISIYNICTAYCIYKLIRFIVNKFKKEELINDTNG